MHERLFTVFGRLWILFFMFCVEIGTSDGFFRYCGWWNLIFCIRETSVTQTFGRCGASHGVSVIRAEIVFDEQPHVGLRGFLSDAMRSINRAPQYRAAGRDIWEVLAWYRIPTFSFWALLAQRGTFPGCQLRTHPNPTTFYYHSTTINIFFYLFTGPHEVWL